MNRVLLLLATIASLCTATAMWAQRPVDVATFAVAGLASGLDVASTVACRNPQTCTEGNPLAALFFDPQHPGYLIALDVGVVLGITALSSSMRRSQHPNVRRLWWAPAVTFTAVSLVQWRNNVSELRRCGAPCRLPPT